MSKFALQIKLINTWTYVGINEYGTRVLFNSQKEAEDDLAEDMPDLLALGSLKEEWRVVPYIATEDKFIN